jgi:hypothetical protein
MGNGISSFCNYSHENKKMEIRNMSNEEKEFYSNEKNLIKVKQIQGKFREIKSNEILKKNLKSLEEQFDFNLNTIGHYIQESEFEITIEKNVKDVEKILGPLNYNENEYKKKYKNVFKKPPIKFFDEGSIYKGEWNIQGKKHGYGILVMKDGSKYEGFWKNDQLDGVGRFIEKRGNYYDGNFLIFLIFLIFNFLLFPFISFYFLLFIK